MGTTSVSICKYLGPLGSAGAPQTDLATKKRAEKGEG